MADEFEKRVSRLRAASSFEEHAYEAHMAVWNQRDELFGGNVPSQPLDLVDPAIALHLKGFQVRSDPNIGEAWDCGEYVRTAGILDLRRKIVRVSPAISEQERRFTIAHELGHIILHPGMTGLHRDRPVSGPCVRRDQRERDADAFASCYIMPAKHLFQRLSEKFAGMGEFVLNEDTVYGLRLGSVDEAQRRMRTLRNVSLVIATATSFMGSSFESLVQYFRVSPTAMAIRLEEIGVVTDRSLRRAW